MEHVWPQTMTISSVRTTLTEQIYINITVWIFQTKWFRLHCIYITAGSGHISSHYPVGGLLASSSWSHLLCSGSWMQFGVLIPAWNIRCKTSRVHWRHWETNATSRCVKGVKGRAQVWTLQTQVGYLRELQCWRMIQSALERQIDLG